MSPWFLTLALFGSSFACPDGVGSPDAVRTPSRMRVDSASTGWTVFTPSTDTRKIHVSSSTGDDANDGLSEAKPKRTISAGKALLRDGHPDWLLLKKGDAWDAPLGRWGLSGRSPKERMLVSSYGVAEERPLLRTGESSGFDGLDGMHNDDLAIVGLHFWAHSYTGGKGSPRGIQLYGSVRDFLLEDCCIQAFDTNIVIQGTPDNGGRHTDIAIRRNVIVDAYTTTKDNAEGIYVSGTDGLLLEENVIDHNGWRDDVEGSTPNWFRHNVYIQNGCTGVVFRGNTVSGTDGLQQRPGGLCENNLFLKNALALQFGSGTSPEPGGVTGTVRNNVILDGRDIDAGNPRGWGLITGNVVNARFESNIVAHNATGTGPNPWVLNFDNGNGNPQGMQHCVFDHNIVYDWGSAGRGAQSASYQSSALVDLTLSHNDIQGTVDKTYLAVFSSTTPNLSSQIHGLENRWYRASGDPKKLFQVGGADMSFEGFKKAIGDTTSTFGAVKYPDPNRTIATYHASIGGTASYEAFIAEARKQSKSNWRPKYTAEAVNGYIRAGFGR
jgi:hypothetical protein